MHSLAIAPRQVIKGTNLVSSLGSRLPQFGQTALVIGGARALANTKLDQLPNLHYTEPVNNCSEANLGIIASQVNKICPDFIIGLGGGKVLDLAKLVAHHHHLPVVTIPTTAATCAGWTALSNIYTDTKAFSYDVALNNCPDLLVVDYGIIATAPKRTLVAGIGDAIAKWYEASVSSGTSSETLIIAAVQSARILRDILFQKSAPALNQPRSPEWQEVVDATVCLAGVIGGLGGAQCRTVAAHAVHNGLTHLPQAQHLLHGELVAFGILVQLRLEEFNGNQLAATARQQLLKFYGEIGLPITLTDLGLVNISLEELQTVAAIACGENSDLHNLPFAVHAHQLLAAMVSTDVTPEASTPIYLQP